MQAEVHGIWSSDVDVDTYVSEDPTNDGVWIRLDVGPAGSGSYESFDILVCTPQWIRDVVIKEGPQIGRHRLIMEPLDLRTAMEFLRRRIDTISGSNWAEVGEKVARLGYWEFEDYQLHRPTKVPPEIAQHEVPRSGV